MKPKFNILLISFLLLSGLMGLAFVPTTSAQVDDTTVVIGVINGQNKYNVTEINLEPNTEYTIIFENIDTLTGHNLRIDTNQDLEDNSNIGDSNDILIGEPNDSADGKGVNSWTGTWTTPEDGEYIFYCGYAGHYSAGMDGLFIVGEGEPSPGFGLFAGIAALFLIGLAIPQLRRR